jgi:hypothetical protein
MDGELAENGTERQFLFEGDSRQPFVKRFKANQASNRSRGMILLAVGVVIKDDHERLGEL